MNDFARYWQYQRERFPLFAHLPMVAAYALCAVACSAWLRGAGQPAPIASSVSAGVSVLLLFWQLRVADEFKDFEDDRRLRPYRPVPRGLVTLDELGRSAFAAALAQLLLAAFVSPRLIPLLGLVWTWMLLMRVEFFAPQALRRRPLLYMASHLLILPLMSLYASAHDWLPAAGRMPGGLVPLLGASFFGGMVFELGRKIRAPGYELPGIDTYSAIWGPTRAVGAWWAALAAAFGCSLAMAGLLNAIGPLLILVFALSAAALVIGWRLMSRPARWQSRAVECVSGLAILGLYGAIATFALAGSAGVFG